MTISKWQYAGTETVLGERFSDIERRLDAPPQRPGVGDWVLDMDATGTLVAINLRSNLSYPITLGTPVPLP